MIFTEERFLMGNQRGSFMILFAVSLLAILAVVAIGIEVGRWYTVRSEMSKAVDAASLVGAKNSSNPYVDPELLTTQVAKANFQDGLLGTDGAPKFTVMVDSDGKVIVDGTTDVLNTVGRTVQKPNGTTHKQTAVGARGAAHLRKSEVMLVLDRSGSMSGQPWTDLQSAAVSFLEFFEASQGADKFGLIMFETAAKVYRPLGTDFVDPMTAIINATNTADWTNSEEAIDQADGPDGFSDQSGFTSDLRVEQFLVFFSDGKPTAFRHEFTRNGQAYDAVAISSSSKTQKMYNPLTGKSLGVNQYNTGDGFPTATSACGSVNTKWSILADAVYGTTGSKAFPILRGVDPEQCSISRSWMRQYVDFLSAQMAIDHAAELKAKGVLIFSIGLGNIDQDFLLNVSSGEGYVFHTPDSSELEALFHEIAATIKLRLIK